MTEVESFFGSTEETGSTGLDETGSGPEGKGFCEDVWLKGDWVFEVKFD